MRLAGTWARYSSSATPQLTSAATCHGLWLSSFKWAYQANVMNTFENIKSKTVCAKTGIRASHRENHATPAERERCEAAAPGSPSRRAKVVRENWLHGPFSGRTKQEQS